VRGRVVSLCGSGRNIWLPVGEHVLHVSRERLGHAEIAVVKGETRNSNGCRQCVRVMQGELLAKELPRRAHGRKEGNGEGTGRHLSFRLR
jgi:hypothetical protein